MRGGMPFERPADMPVQDLKIAPPAHKLGATPLRVVFARLLTILCTLGLAGYGVFEMLGIVSFSNMTVLQGVMIVFFAITLLWICFSAASAITGFLVPAPRAPSAPSIAGSRTALVMPIYNEDPGRTTAALYAMAEALAQIDAARHFEIAIISDSTNADAWISESLAVDQLRRDLRETMPVWYRRRWHNTGRKAGNVEDFVKRWGARYEYMIVLDADSIMAPQTLVTLVNRMQADPQLGILQTVPMLIGHWSLFSRIQQFAGRVYGSSIGRGVAAWSGNEGNYWGHNAIIRVAAFAQACGMPQLPGRRPFGGHVLSHDFVEAALMRRAGWKVRMASDLGGSWEESPPSLVDIAIRDRRWAQGNLQHSKIIDAKGLALTNRAHFAIGIMSYLSSPLWMLLLIVGFALTLQATLIRPEYFSRSFQLFPSWPQFDAPRMTALFVFTMVVLFTPKILGLVRTIFSSRTRRGLRRSPGARHGRSRGNDPVGAIRTDHDAGTDPAHHRDHDRPRLGLERAASPLAHDDVERSLEFPLAAPGDRHRDRRDRVHDLTDAARVAHADTRRPAARRAAVEDQRQRQARAVSQLVPHPAHAGREARARGDPAA